MSRNSDDAWILVLAIAVVVIGIIVTIIVYGGAFIGAFYSLKNYFISFKQNVIDSNREIQAA
jgi:uncharacterized membrane protein